MYQTAISKHALVSRYAQQKGNSMVLNGTLVALGVLLLTILSRITLPLPFTPVPLTGQTFGVVLIALMGGRIRGFATVASYLALGFAGLPLFTHPQSLMALGPTSGYLVGMLVSAWIIGALSDRGWTLNFKLALLASAIGSVFIYAFGLLGLQLFVKGQNIFALGLWPFLPGDLIKCVLAAGIASRANQRP